MLMPDDGFESITYLFTIWGKNENFYLLESIIDTTLSVSIGGIIIHKIIEKSDNTFLIKGNSSGGDAEESWSSDWTGILTLPNSLKIVNSTEN